MDIQKMEQDLNDLALYARLEGCELGELCEELVCLAYKVSYGASEEFQASLEKEIEEQLNFFKTNAKVVERKETQTFTHKELEWNQP